MVLQGERLGGGVCIDRLAELTPGYSGSDLKQLCVAAAMRPVRAFLEAEGSSGGATGGAAFADREQAELEPAEVPEATAPAPDSTEGSIDGDRGAGGGSGGGHQHTNGCGPAASVEQQRAAGSIGARSEAASGSATSSSPAASLRLVPRLDSLLRQAERLASAPRSLAADLRPILMEVRRASGGRQCTRHASTPGMAGCPVQVGSKEVRRLPCMVRLQPPC